MSGCNSFNFIAQNFSDCCTNTTVKNSLSRLKCSPLTRASVSWFTANMMKMRSDDHVRCRCQHGAFLMSLLNILISSETLRQNVVKMCFAPTMLLISRCNLVNDYHLPEFLWTKCRVRVLVITRYFDLSLIIHGTICSV